VSFKGLEANTILSELRNVAASAGAACHSDRIDVSSVLEAMAVPLEYAMGTIRFSVGRFTRAADVDQALDEVRQVVERLEPVERGVSIETDPKEVKLTQYTHGLGCACKLRPQLLEKVLSRMPAPIGGEILVGLETADDAAVYRIDQETAIVQTVDFFTPVVDDPYQFGAIAAANSLSDIYAMGAKPLFALSVVGFPSNRLPVEVLEKILDGARSKADEAGIAIIGGHTVDDTEPKFGLAVSGLIDPERIVTNSNAKPDDVLVLTKPLGTGILSTALKRGLLEAELAESLVETMATLNKAAAEAMQAVGVNSCTDVTGFGLLGHLLEMMRASHTSARIEVSKVGLLPGVMELATSGVVSGGTRDNMDYTDASVQYEDGVSSIQRLVLNDAQTSGGLLISVQEAKAEMLMKALEAQGVRNAAIVGRVTAESPARITVQAKALNTSSAE
jgi:cysteine desulfurase